jgi:hypothetical protein
MAQARVVRVIAPPLLAGAISAASAEDTPGFPAVGALIGGLLGTALALSLRRPRDDAQWAGFLGAFVGGWFGLVFYLIALIGG